MTCRKIKRGRHFLRQSKQGKANDKDKEKTESWLEERKKKKGRNQPKHIEKGMYEREKKTDSRV